MRLSELHRRSGVSTASIKYYLREGLLPPGRTTAANQAQYDESHLHRLKLIRALIGVRGLSVSDAKQVLALLSSDEARSPDRLGGVLRLLPGTDLAPNGHEDPRTDASETNALMEKLGWRVPEGHPARRTISRSLHALRSLGLEVDWTMLLPYARIAEQTATLDLDRARPSTDPGERAEHVVLLALLLEPALLALRRLAQESESTARHE
ncbi:MerR family transcriptional regulator [Streptomyces sp. NPDC058877]|uniref:MerR family transcriptional regulator n=1 Tax=unclassified Streptomyces TaxID=2593676 RepID=UPI0036A92BCA